MSIGYACLAIGVPDTNMKRCLIKNANDDRLSQLIAENLNALNHLIDYNIKNGIKLFRISSDLIPFGSSHVNMLKWWELFDTPFQLIGDKLRSGGIRVSMHPGQYTVLNSPDRDVVERAILDLNYHAKVLDCLGTGKEHKIVLHIGGVYQDKERSIERFIANYHRLPDSIKERLVIENDDKSYNIEEVLQIGLQLNIPVVFDILHHQSNPPVLFKQDNFWINECGKTWHEKDGRQKIHYAQQDQQKKKGSHSSSIRIKDFITFFSSLQNSEIDIMLEVKDKNLSAIKCLNCVSTDRTIKDLESEWSRYKYNVLEKSPLSYTQLRNLLKNKSEYPAIAFYDLLDTALQQKEEPGNAINGLQHVWGYLKDWASIAEKEAFLKKIEDYRNCKINLMAIKRFLWRLTVKYKQQYLLNSYFFIL